MVQKDTVLVLSDGIDFPLYLALAQGIAPAARSLGWRVVLRPHPLERTAVAAQYGDESATLPLIAQANCTLPWPRRTRW